MEFKTVILRFRDLVTENDGTISKHKDLISKKVMFGGGGGIKEMKKFLLTNFPF